MIHRGRTLQTESAQRKDEAESRRGALDEHTRSTNHMYRHMGNREVENRAPCQSLAKNRQIAGSRRAENNF